MRKPLSEETLNNLREAIESGQSTVILAPQDQTEELSPYIDQILEALGHPEALVTDESMIGDFRSFGITHEEKEIWLNGLSEKLGIPIKSNDYLVDLSLILKGNSKA